jgi:hypothetical protein
LIHYTSVYLIEQMFSIRNISLPLYASLFPLYASFQQQKITNCLSAYELQQINDNIRHQIQYLLSIEQRKMNFDETVEYHVLRILHREPKFQNLVDESSKQVKIEAQRVLDRLLDEDKYHDIKNAIHQHVDKRIDENFQNIIFQSVMINTLLAGIVGGIYYIIKKN